MSEAPPPAAAPQPAVPLTAAEDKQWASFAHFGGVLGILPSLIIFLVFKDRGEKTRQESKEALNWQITFTGAWVILNIVGFIITQIAYSVGFYFIAPAGGWLIFLLWVANIVFSIMGGVRVNGGGSYRYPVAVRLIK